MRFLLMFLAIFCTFACAMAEVKYQPAVPPALMPDGTPFLSLERPDALHPNVPCQPEQPAGVRRK